MKRWNKIKLGCWVVFCTASIVIGIIGWTSTPRQWDVTFSSTGPDPPLLAATVYSPGTLGLHPGVVVFHGVGGSRFGTAGIGIALARAGITALCVDDRGHGGSGGYLDASNVSQWNLTFYDAFAALDFLAGLDGVDTSRLGAQGYSLGGAQATLLALNDSRLTAVAAWAPAIGRYRFDTPVRDLPVPPSSWAIQELILQGTADTTCPPGDAQALAARWDAVTLELLAGVNHYITGQVWVDCLDRTTEFLVQALGVSPSSALPDIWWLNLIAPALTFIGAAGLGIIVIWAITRHRRGHVPPTI